MPDPAPSRNGPVQPVNENTQLPQRTSWSRILPVHQTCSEWPNFLDLTFVRAAANDFGEPNPAIVISCCARTQRERCCVCEIFGAAAHRKDRTFTQVAVRSDVKFTCCGQTRPSNTFNLWQLTSGCNCSENHQRRSHEPTASITQSADEVLIA